VSKSETRRRMLDYRQYSKRVPPKMVGQKCTVCTLPTKLRSVVENEYRAGTSVAHLWRWLRDEAGFRYQRWAVYNHLTTHMVSK